MEESDAQEMAQETPGKDVFIAPSIHEQDILLGNSYTHHTPVPKVVRGDLAVECVLGVDEAGRGPVLGTPCRLCLNSKLIIPEVLWSTAFYICLWHLTVLY
jgi:ribonuclease H2 subunit A